MNTLQNRIDKILIELGKPNLFEIRTKLTIKVTHRLLPFLVSKYSSLSKEDRIKIYEAKYKEVEKELLKLLYIRNGSKAKGIDYGYLYIITNPNFPDYMKVGISIDVLKRLSSYQTYSPFRDYKLDSSYLVKYTKSLEKFLHNRLNADFEWVKDNCSNRALLEKAVNICSITSVSNNEKGYRRKDTKVLEILENL